MEKQTQRIDLWTWGGEERMRCMERVAWKLTSSYVKYTANGNLLCGSGNSNGLCITLEGLAGEGHGREVQKGGDILIPMVYSCQSLTENNKIL